MNDQRFFDLAMKVIAHQATNAERAEMDLLLAREPELRAKFDRLQTDVRRAKDALPLVEATQATAGELPAYARGRLQTKVRQTFGRPATEKVPDRSLTWIWRLVLGLAAAAAMILFLTVPQFRGPTAPIIQVAMLDTAGGTRGMDGNETKLLRETWKDASLDFFSRADALREWESKAKPNIVKVVFDRAAGEVRVLGQWKGKSLNKTFPVDQDLATALKEAKEFLQTETKR